MECIGYIGNDSGVSVFSFVPGIVDTPLVHEVIVPQSAATLGITEDQVLPLIAHNPGYEGLMPVDHCATALAYAMQRETGSGTTVPRDWALARLRRSSRADPLGASFRVPGVLVMGAVQAAPKLTT